MKWVIRCEMVERHAVWSQYYKIEEGRYNQGKFEEDSI